jgi:hypothetical protein
LQQLDSEEPPDDKIGSRLCYVSEVYQIDAAALALFLRLSQTIVEDPCVIPHYHHLLLINKDIIAKDSVGREGHIS